MKTAKLGISETARRLGLSRTMVIKLVNERKLRAEMTPYGRVFLEKDVEALRESREKEKE
jgi:excisionase family DNA binding protein